MRKWAIWPLILALLALVPAASAQQMNRFGDVDVHYVVFNTQFLTPEIAHRYGITRGRDWALLNVSVIGRDGMPQSAAVAASYVNLLGQRVAIPLAEIQEAEAIYYLGAFRYTDQDTLRFHVGVRTRSGSDHSLSFQQRMYVETR
jgi:hypothetical protein